MSKKTAHISRTEIQQAIEEFKKDGGKIDVLPPQEPERKFNHVNQGEFNNFYSSGSYISGLGASHA